MKQLFFILAISAAFCVHAQTNVASNISVIPTAVTDAFQKKFPTATEVQWDSKTTKTSADVAVYHVSFDMGMTDKDNDVWIDKDGNILKHQKEIKAAQLPEAVQQSVRKHFPGYSIGDADRVEDNGAIRYVFEIKNGGNERKIMTDEAGNIKANLQD
jgi:hypothetical protein